MEKEQKSFIFIGGDLRQARLADMLYEDGNSVGAYGIDFAAEFKNDITIYTSLNRAVKSAQYVILPLPYSKDGVNINAPFSDKQIEIQDIVKYIRSDNMVIGGKLDSNITDALDKKNIKYYDVMEYEELAVYNSIPTAEGALQIAMEETDRTIHNSRCLIIGFGRIGEILAKILMALGAEITVSARKIKDFSWMFVYGYNQIKTSEIAKNINKFDIIFNTVPAEVINEAVLRKVKKDALIIDLASAPGGVDFDAAKKLPVKMISALSLPGKVAPASAGEYLKKTIYNILEVE